MASLHISTLEPFGFARPENWPRWVDSESVQADDLLHSFSLENKDVVKEMLKKHCLKRRNVYF